MWSCKYCLCQFDFTRTTDKANHTKHCGENPNRKAFYEKMLIVNRERFSREFGDVKKFQVSCFSCNKSFSVEERETLFPSKQSYFCSRSCSNSIGGSTKAQLFGYTDYRTIAYKTYKPICVACGVEDILDVHHIDENRNNNLPSNLIILCPNDHYRFHRNKDIRIASIIESHLEMWKLDNIFC